MKDTCKKCGCDKVLKIEDPQKQAFQAHVCCSCCNLKIFGKNINRMFLNPQSKKVELEFNEICESSKRRLSIFAWLFSDPNEWKYLEQIKREFFQLKGLLEKKDQMVYKEQILGLVSDIKKTRDQVYAHNRELGLLISHLPEVFQLEKRYIDSTDEEIRMTGSKRIDDYFTRVAKGIFNYISFLEGFCDSA